MIKAQEALNQAKVGLMVHPKAVFFSNVSMQLEHSISTEVPTAGVSGKSVVYNPDFFLGLTKQQRISLVLHEVCHVAYLHMYRIGTKNFKVWNKACDYVINNFLVENGFTLPPEGLVNPLFSGMSSEQVYEILLNKQEDTNYTPDITPEDGDPMKEYELTNILIKAVQRTEQAGYSHTIPGDIKYKLQNILNPRANYRELLSRYLDSFNKEDISWKRLNRKYSPNYILPSRYSQKLDNLTIAIDTSGSMTAKLLQEILSDIQYIKDVMQPNNLIILDCDMKIHNIYKVDSGDNINEYTFTGGGGTDVHPILKYCNENSTNLLVYFTDGEFKHPSKEQEYPIVWIITGDNKTNISIGDTIFVD